MARHLLDPSPEFNGLRGFVGVMDSAFERVGREGLFAQSVRSLNLEETG